MMKNIILMLVVLIIFTGCSIVKPLQIPIINETANSDSKFGEYNANSAIALSKLFIDVDRGKEIISFPNRGEYKGKDSVYCNATGGAKYAWLGGRHFLGDWSSQYGKDFYDVMTQFGYKVAGNSSELFFQKDAINSAEYIVGGRLIDLKSNYCHLHHWWDGRPLNRYSGETYVKIEWSVLNSLTKEIVKITTEGYGVQPKPVADGIYLSFSMSLIDATEAFAKNDILKKLVAGEQINSNLEQNNFRKIKIKNAKPMNKFDMEKIKPHVVTIRVGTGHGSGLIIGNNGYIITNAHVVGDAKNVQIITALGLEITGKVISRNKIRDVALIETPLKLRNAISINPKLPKSGSEVYAIGTPLSEKLSMTVTKGIVSAIRKDSASGNMFIQSDVAVSAGSSGGPLFDNLGNVIGLSFAQYVGNNISGLNLFIPIREALEYLNINLVQY